MTYIVVAGLFAIDAKERAALFQSCILQAKDRFDFR
jgi:hypothetical protein